MLLKYIEKYRNFEHFSHLILDEIHERNIEMDFLLIFIKHLLQIRQDIKVILMRYNSPKPIFFKYIFYIPVHQFKLKNLVYILIIVQYYVFREIFIQ
jgi:hypothetical protein